MKQLCLGVLLGMLASTVHCFPVQPAHADYASAEIADAIDKQTHVLDRIARALEKCK